MGQRANSGRNATLDQKKARAQGRAANPARARGGADEHLAPGQNRAGGASGFGKGKAASRGGALTKGGGGGGAAADSTARSAPGAKEARAARQKAARKKAR